MSLEGFPENEQFHKDAYERDKTAEEGGSFPVVFLKKGVTQVRIPPPYSERGSWYHTIEEHSVKGGDGSWNTITCPRAFEKRCPFCDEGEELMAKGKETEDTEMVDRGKDFKPRVRFYSNVIVYSSPDNEMGPSKGVQVLKYGVTVKRTLLGLNQDEGGWAKITDLKKGVDIKIIRSGEGLNTSYEVQPMPDRTDLVAKLKSLKVDVKEFKLHNLDLLYPPQSYEDLVSLKESGRRTAGFRPAPNPVPAEAPTETPPAPTPAPAPQEVATAAGAAQDVPVGSAVGTAEAPPIPDPPPSAAE